MALYCYLKAKPAYLNPPRPSLIARAASHFLKLIPPVMISVGSIMVANVAWPIVSYQFITAPQLNRQPMLAPISSDVIEATKQQMRSRLLAPTPVSQSQVLGADVDYTKVHNWFPQASPMSDSGLIDTYALSIPKVDIEQAKVVVGGDDLSQNLIHYPGTAKPGTFGAPVIFGHSVLRQFYNPALSNPKRYISIFSKIMTLKNGDYIYLDYQGSRYTYEVSEKLEVKPDDIFILEQQYSTKELKLITCVPEGTYLRRGVVIARLVNITPQTNLPTTLNY